MQPQTPRRHRYTDAAARAARAVRPTLMAALNAPAALAIALVAVLAMSTARIASAHEPDAHAVDARLASEADVAAEAHSAADATDIAAADAAISAMTSLSTWRYNHDAHRGAYRLSDGRTGTNLADVQALLFDASSVFVRSTGIPRYDIGPFNDRNPAVPGAQDYLFRLPLAPSAAASPRATGLGNIGAFVNGVPMYNALDAFSWSAAGGADVPNMGGMGGQRGDGVWNRNAAMADRRGFDACLGHPAPGRAQNGGAASGRYHHHIDPICLRTELGDTDPTRHSPIIGWAFDGYPLYGPYGYGDPNDPASPVRRMRSSYAVRAITTRTTLPDGSAVPAGKEGPPVSAAFPIGWYAEDFVFQAGSGDLDVFNGRFARTPEFPDGTYAYFTTIDEAGQPAYPYLIGPRYRGEVAADNLGPMARVSVPPGAATWIPPLGTAAPPTATPDPPTMTPIPPTAASTAAPTITPPATTATPATAEPTPTTRPAAQRCYLPWAARLVSTGAP